MSCRHHWRRVKRAAKLPPDAIQGVDMPGMFTPHKGSSLPTSTVWFGGVAEWLNMLKRWDGAFDGSNFATDAGLFGATLGAFTTAPDGTTNTAQLIQEDTSTGQHALLLCTSWYST